MAAKTAVVRARIEPDLKERAEAILEALKIKPGEAISMFYDQIILKRGLPFETKVPNELTAETLRKAEAGIDLHEVGSVEQLFEELEA